MFKAGKIIVAAGLVMFSGALLAQEPLDGAYQKVITKEKEIIPYEHLNVSNQADIVCFMNLISHQKTGKAYVLPLSSNHIKWS